MKILTRFVAPILGAALLFGCAGQKNDMQDAMPAVDNVCIISGEPVDDDCPTAEYMGHTVKFCCKKCLRKWNEMDDAGRQAKFDAMK